MKNQAAAKFPHNAKITKGNCVKCSGPLAAHRFDAKYCSDLCRVQDSNNRTEKGYTKLAVKGTKQRLIEFVKMPGSSIFSPWNGNDQTERIEKIILANGKDKSWLEDSNDFRLYYIAHNKKNPFELFYTNNKYFDWLIFSGRLTDVRVVPPKQEN